MGMKGPDMIAVYACSACHDALDKRGRGEVDPWDVIRAVAETQIKFMAKGLMNIKGVK